MTSSDRGEVRPQGKGANAAGPALCGDEADEALLFAGGRARPRRPEEENAGNEHQENGALDEPPLSHLLAPFRPGATGNLPPEVSWLCVRASRRGALELHNDRCDDQP